MLLRLPACERYKNSIWEPRKPAEEQKLESISCKKKAESKDKGKGRVRSRKREHPKERFGEIQK
jgi:hypothetical protein